MEIPLNIEPLTDEATAKFDEAVTCAIKACTSMKKNLTYDYHRIIEEVRLLALEENKHRRRWQRTIDPDDKVAYNRAAGKLRRDMQAF